MGYAREITKSELANHKFICEGYKVVKCDNSTNQDFRYAKDGVCLTGKAFIVDGELKECENGLHFCKNKEKLKKFYGNVSWNHYYAIKAYDEVIDSSDNNKSVARIIEFCEEIPFIDFIKLNSNSNGNNRSEGNFFSSCNNHSYGNNSSHGNNYSDGNNYSSCNNSSNGNNYSDGNNYSCGSNYSNGNNRSNGNNCSDGNNCSSGNNRSNGNSYSYGNNRSHGNNCSSGCDYSNACNYSHGSSECYGLFDCNGSYMSAFCIGMNGIAFRLFNKEVSEERARCIINNLIAFEWFPKWNNIYDIKPANSWLVPFPRIKENSKKGAWSSMPDEMRSYIKSLPEYDDEIFRKITGEER